ncbi:hypothetical protein Mal64_04750 [Pseudobythopirellula maris]|uniref:Uncharacterized protein n=1 Tax=Pseudobythopirellula maris TaxID=2527991 RepID=A0A5C5ZRB3_9BACT|nr:DUF1016 domain-containing protein [Pseudobythopirellula maris]TWT90092.1 hypothetical protein Mal64_04750 [Pseudobythopirellula maris]
MNDPTPNAERSMPAGPPEMSVGPFRFTSVGVRIKGRPDIDAWKGPLQFALWCQRAGPWWIGDLLNAGEDNFGEVFSQMCEGAISGDQLNRYASVARRVPIGNRLASQSWSAHVAVARLDNAGQRRFLKLSEKHGWSSEELRRNVRDYQRQRKSE